jgi:hypothetical protein
MSLGNSINFQAIQNLGLKTLKAELQLQHAGCRAFVNVATIAVDDFSKPTFQFAADVRRALRSPTTTDDQVHHHFVDLLP